MLRVFPVSLTGAASRWLRNEPSGSITNWETSKMKFLNKYCPPARTAKKIEEINNFQQEPDESLFRAWKRFKELLMKCPQHYLTDIQEVILFYNGLDVPTRHILDLKGVIPTKTVADAKVVIQEMAEYSQKWHNGTSSKARSTETSDGLAVGCELCKGPHYTKDCPLEEEEKSLEEAYYTQFEAPYQPRGQYRAAGPGFYQRNNGNSSYPDRRQTLKESLTKFMAESAKRHEENSNIIKEIRASTDATIRNQGASIKTLEIQIGQMSKVLQKRGIRSLSVPYAVSDAQYSSLSSETVPFPNRLHGYCCDNWKEVREVKILETYDHTLPQKEKDSRSFTLPCFIHNISFDKALVDLGASVSVTPFSTYSNLGLGDLAHTRLTIELADRTIKHPRGIAENVLVRIGKFIFTIDFVILDIPEDDNVYLILGRPFLSTAHAKIDVFKRKFILRVGEEKLVFKSVKPATSIIRRVYMVKERTDLEFVGEAINESFEPLYGNYIELNDLDLPLEPRTNQGDFEPTPNFVSEPACKSCYKMKFSCIIGYRHVNADFFLSLSINIMTKRFYNSIIKDKGDHEGKNLAGTLIDIFVGKFSIISGFSITDDIDITSGVVLGMPFCKKFLSCQKIMERFTHGDKCERMDE
ncbi:retrovirus-related pol polyprotein from transposon TNT 1-94 [Tanacetum coccineum]